MVSVVSIKHNSLFVKTVIQTMFPLRIKTSQTSGLCVTKPAGVTVALTPDPDGWRQDTVRPTS